MGRNREPIKLIQAKGKTHLTKNEIAQREGSEIPVIDDDIVPPDFLTEKEKEKFNKIATQLKIIGIMSNLDCDVLARYIKAESDFIFYEGLIEGMQKKLSTTESIEEMGSVLGLLAVYDKLKNRAFNQCHTCASSLGMTITSRCKIVLPKTAEVPKENKFARFIKDG